MKETTHRPIEDIWNELSNHPDFIAGAYYDKGTILDYVADELQDGSYDDDDKLYEDAEWVIENNARRIEKNINSSWECGMQGCIFSDDCDLPTEQKNN
jgi:hypothetical protein